MNNSTDFPPLYCWIVTLGRSLTVDEYQLCFRHLDKPSQSKVMGLMNKARTGDPSYFQQAIGSLCGRLLPHIIMKQRGVERWSIRGNEDGKKPFMISPGEDKQMGYNNSRDGSLVVMAFALGAARNVLNVGCDVRRIQKPPKVPISIFVESLSHKITPLERSFLSPKFGEEVVLRRIYILWTVKEAYLKAIGQPLEFGFAWDRIECNIPEETVTVDGEPLHGWEFRLFKANVGVPKNNKIEEEVYQVTCAIYRGEGPTKFVWNQKPTELDSWLRFVTVESFLDAVVQLGQPLPSKKKPPLDK